MDTNYEIHCEITDKFAKWAAFSGTRSGCPIKARRDVYPLIQLPNYDFILSGDKPITKDVFNKWHRKASLALLEQKPIITMGWATKIINLYLKTMVYVGQYGRPGLVEVIHPPIDQGLWRGLKGRYDDRKEITSKIFCKASIKSIIKYDDYKVIISGMELIAVMEECLLIEVEQFWKGTEYK